MPRMLALVVALILASGASLAETRVPATDGEIRLSFAPVVKISAPSVVNIYARRVVAAQASPFANDPFFSDFFKNFGQPTDRVQSSLGSGVVLSSDGLVVSNYHVVGGATAIRVSLADRREFDAEVLLADEQSDLAVLRLKGASGLAAMPLRPSDQIEVGDLVLAIGNPFGVGQTVSSGIISGLARSGGALGNARAYFIQTDAPINPGNSGGALVDMTGALVGINTSILTRSGGSNGIGFAIPADLVAAFLKQARAGNTSFVRPWAGLIGQSVDSNLAEGFDLALPEGMVIVDLHSESPFAQAGLAVGDVIVSFASRPVNGPQEMLHHMSVAGIGADADVTYLRDSTRRTARVAMIAPPEIPARDTTEITDSGPLQGLIVARINPGVIAEMNLSMQAFGVVVVSVKGFAAQIGFQPGDILTEVNDRAIATVRDVRRAATDRPKVWSISIERGGQTLSMRFRI
ncbi:MAG: trypsin-like peptidase domain-containing protein [Rhodobacteraceae bacterium]|nr:trypsin-like peptidase domain-containing protein [Paracoccaceae bacterium]